MTPDQSGYASARLSYNPLFDGRQPSAVALCANVSDVQACVTAAAKARAPIAARSGGHSYIGRSTPTGALVVDLKGLSGVRVLSDGTAVIGPGSRLGDVYSSLAAAGRCLPAGSCSTVGVGGLATGGGIGVLARKFGLTCDRLVSASVVTADGVLRTVDSQSDPDLFWALRGGGGGNFGIVVSFTFSTAPAPDVTVFALRFPAGSLTEVLGAWQHWITAAPDELWADCNVQTGASPSCVVTGSFVGTPAALAPSVTALIQQAGVQPSSRYVQSMGYLNAMHYYSGSSARESFVASSRVMSAPLADPSGVVAACTGRTGTAVIFDGLGGAVGRIAPDATAFPHRSAVATVQIYRGTTSSGQSSATADVTAVRDALTEVLGHAAYVNYLDATTPVQDYYLGNLPRLRQVAQHYDPNAVFSSIGT